MWIEIDELGFCYPNQIGLGIKIEQDEIKSFFKPIFKNGDFLEGATPEEIAEFNKVQVPEKIGAIPFLVQLELMGINESAIVSKIDFLHQNGILSDQQKIEALISVKRATIFERNHPFIALIANAFEISKERVDQIFINVNQL